jgi:hypothetical protein
VAEEKWHFYRAKREAIWALSEPRTPAAMATFFEPAPPVENGLKHKRDFAALFPMHYTSREGEMALVLWDFLDRCVAEVGGVKGGAGGVKDDPALLRHTPLTPHSLPFHPLPLFSLCSSPVRPS